MIRGALLFGAALALAACQPSGTSRAGIAGAGASEESRSYAAFYAGLEARLLREGRLRRDAAPADAPVTASILARNFETIALSEEAILSDGRRVPGVRRDVLRRWARPVRVQLHFAPDVPEALRRGDRARLASYVSRLGRVTGHPMRLVGERGNFHVFVAPVDAAPAVLPRMAAASPRMPQGALRRILDPDRGLYCSVTALPSALRDDVYDEVVIFVRAEHPDLFRTACYHEEIAQGLGLLDDDPGVRPSIFNDDEEFAYLTGHDEMLLRMLYDPRLSPGMSRAEVRPVAARIAAELTASP